MSTFALTIGTLPVHLGAQAAATDVERAAATITPDDFQWRVEVMAHDSMRGRDTPSPELEETALWIASEFRRLGLRGGAEDGGFLQHYPLESTSIDVASSRIEASTGAVMRFGEEIMPIFGAPATGSVEAGVVVVSGTRSPTGGSAIEVAGKHVILVFGDAVERVGRAQFGVIRTVMESGPASILVVTGMGAAAFRRGAARGLRPSVRRPGGEAPEAPPVALLQLRGDAVAPLLAGAGLRLATLQGRGDGEMEVTKVDGLTFDLAVSVAVTPTHAPNVVGILDGTDPVLKDEYVVFSGHMDHVGVGTPDASGDSIYNGADDDASGTAAVMEVAQAMASLEVAPRRSTIFLVVSGEEKGLWGSEYFAEHPSVPVDRMVANLNTDMVGRNWPDTIVAIGKEHSDLGETLDRVNGAHPELRMTAIDDIWPDERFYFRSDHFNFARKGVPILFFFNGVHEDYHRPSDEPGAIDAEKAARIARLVFYLGVDIANATDRPRWNPESFRRIVSDGSP
ncbi:MAG: M20/M25/M40 family metallo-hydrolase [Gemmatimonadota bacterium]|nr:M20/M25/M40 family metallo-hydrolase [Gemmatimonadota bacterium]MDH5758882.1 M20/M25/M40 family metallo-hydrolase [Gemmatimonadota bacterium]